MRPGPGCLWFSGWPGGLAAEAPRPEANLLSIINLVGNMGQQPIVEVGAGGWAACGGTAPGDLVPGVVGGPMSQPSPVSPGPLRLSAPSPGCLAGASPPRSPVSWCSHPLPLSLGPLQSRSPRLFPGSVPSLTLSMAEQHAC